jgi:hypothetical protein
VTQVAATRTPCTDEELIAALRAACPSPVTDATLAILCAHVALETGHSASMVCWNLGNYKRGPGPDWCSFQTFEYLGIPPLRTTVIADFSAWPDLASAASFYVPAFAHRWPEAWAGALTGDADAFCSGLKARGYYTAPEPVYAAGVKRWQRYYLAVLAADESVTQPDMSDLGPTGSVTIPG